jgi:hypothetical protein
MPAKLSLILDCLDVNIPRGLELHRTQNLTPSGVFGWVDALLRMHWCATWLEIWKWIQFGTSAAQLGIGDEELHIMMGEDPKCVERLERARERVSSGQPLSYDLQSAFKTRYACETKITS